MFSCQSDRAGLSSLFAHLLHESNPRTEAQFRKVAVEHAVAMKIDVTSPSGVSSTPKSFSSRVTSRGLRRMHFDLPLQLARLILKLAPGAFERIVESKINVAMALVGARRTVDIDLLVIG